MTIIQKRADELSPGDVVLSPDSGQHWVVLRLLGQAGQEVKISFGCIGTGAIEKWRPADEHFEMVRHALTPAQQHAGELVQLVQVMRDSYNNEAARALLDKIKPPEPPTLAEALEALADLAEEPPRVPRARDWALSVLDRARRAGLLE